MCSQRPFHSIASSGHLRKKPTKGSVEKPLLQIMNHEQIPFLNTIQPWSCPREESLAGAAILAIYVSLSVTLGKSRFIFTKHCNWGSAERMLDLQWTVHTRKCQRAENAPTTPSSQPPWFKKETAQASSRIMGKSILQLGLHCLENIQYLSTLGTQVRWTQHPL